MKKKKSESTKDKKKEAKDTTADDKNTADKNIDIDFDGFEQKAGNTSVECR